MRICLLSDPRYVHTQRWAGYFAGRGHDVMIVGGPEAAHIEVPGIGTRPLGTASLRGPWILRTVRALRRVLREFDPDILHMHYLGPLVAPVLLRFRPFLVSVWGADIIGESGLAREPRKERWLKRFILSRADAVLATSTQLARATSVYAGLPQERIAVYPWGVDRNQFAPRRSSNGTGPVLAFIKWLMPKYGPEFLLRAVPTISARYPGVRVLMVGEGPQRQSLEALARDLHIADRVSFPGEIEHADVPNYLAKTDVLVMPSVHESETFGVVAVEAQAMGVPVVASRVGGVPEALDDGVTGLLVPPGDPAAIASAVLRILDDPTLRASMSDEGPRFVARHYDWATNAGRVEGLYRSLLADTRRTARQQPRSQA